MKPPTLRPVAIAGTGSYLPEKVLTNADLQRMVRDDRWKLVVYPKARVVQLFDLGKDPWELENLAGDPAHAGTVARLRGALAEWMRRVDDPLPAASLEGMESWPAPAFGAAGG